MPSTRLMLPLSLYLLVLLHSGATQEDNSAWEQLGINDMVKSKIEQATNGLSERAREYVNKFRDLVVNGEQHNEDDMKTKVNEVKEDFKNADGNVQQEIKSYDNTLKSILTGLKGVISDNNNKRRRRSTQVSKEKVDEVKELSKSLSPEAKRIAHATFAVFRNASLSSSEKTEEVNSIRNNASDKSALQELEQFETKVGEAMNIKVKPVPVGQTTTVTTEGPVKESTTTPVPTMETLQHTGGPNTQNRLNDTKNLETETATADLEATDNIDSSSEEYKYSDEDQDKEVSDEVQEQADDIQNATIEKQKDNEEKVDSAIESTISNLSNLTDTAATLKEQTINTAKNADNAIDTSINKVTIDSS